MALRTAYLHLHRQTEAIFADVGVTADQFVLLSVLADGEHLTQQELAGRMVSDANTLRAMLLLLEKKGLVRRDPHPTDRRARLVCLTPEGQQIQQSLWKRSDRFRERLIDVLGSEDAGTLVALLRRFSGALMPGENAR